MWGGRQHVCLVGGGGGVAYDWMTNFLEWRGEASGECTAAMGGKCRADCSAVLRSTSCRYVAACGPLVTTMTCLQSYSREPVLIHFLDQCAALPLPVPSPLWLGFLKADHGISNLRCSAEIIPRISRCDAEVAKGKMAAHRVLVTGIGLVTPLGVTTRSTWTALLNSTSAVRKNVQHASVPVEIAATIDRDVLPPGPPVLSPCPQFASFALLAAREALLDASQLAPDNNKPPYDPNRAGVSIGVGMAHLPDVINTAKLLDNSTYRKISPFLVPRILPNTPAGLVALRHMLRGPNLAPATACAAGAHALGDAFHIIRRGEADIMLAGGTESAINAVSMAGFARAKALTPSWNDNPQEASRPFDTRRDGFVVGEGACVMVLESEARVREREGEAYAELAGFGMCGDAFHITSPSPDGGGAIRAMSAALTSAEREAKDIHYVNAHATSTPVGDAVERAAIATLLDANKVGDHAVVSSTKGATGHLLGAAGAVESAFTVLSIAESIVPPTLNLYELDDDDAVEQLGWGDVGRFVPLEKRQMPVPFALCNSFGFGGTNACVAFSKVPNDIEQKEVA